MTVSDLATTGHPIRVQQSKLLLERRQTVLLWSALGTALAAVAIWASILPGISLSAIGSTGFIDALDPVFFVAVGLLVVSFVLASSRSELPRWLLATQVVVLLLMLYGTVSIVEPLPRYATSWLHAGFTDYIATTGRKAPAFDARFNWSGFFGAAAMLSKAAGLRSPVTLLKWAPFYFNAIFSVGVYAIAATATKIERARWLAVWLFLSLNWVGQDYYSPQALAYVLALCCAIILLRWFRPPEVAILRGAHARPGRLVSLLRLAPDEVQPETASRLQETILLTVLFLIFGALVVSHQLTPPVVIVWAAALVFARRCKVRSLPLALATIFLIWLSFGTIAYWSGHLKQIFGGIGQFGSSINQNLVSRVSGNASRLFVQHIRLVFTAGAFLLAGLGMLRRRRAGYGDLTYALMALSPLSVLLVQSYGGEALLRSVFLAVPFLAVLGAMAFFPRNGPPSIRSSLAAIAVLVALAPLFFIARYGNEAWDMETPAEHAAFQYVYNTAPAGSTLISIASEVPWGYRDILKFKLVQNATLSSATTAEKELSVGGPGAFLIVTKDQVAFGQLFSGQSPGWASRMEQSLLGTGNYRIVYSNRDAQVITRAAKGAGRR